MNESSNSKYMARKWNSVNDHSNSNYDARNEIICNTQVTKSNLCNYNIYIIHTSYNTILTH